MDITSVASSDIIHFYSRQEKYAEARKKAQARLIKTAVAERVTLSEDARQLAQSIASEAILHTRQVTQPLAAERRSSSVAREYQKNQLPDQPADATQGLKKTETASIEPGRPEAPAPPPRAGAEVQPDLALISREVPRHAFPVPRELKIYLSNLPAEKRSKTGDQARRKAA